MLRCGALVFISLVVSAQVVSSSEDEPREKRQTSPSIRFPLGDNKMTFFEFGGDVLVQLTSLPDDLTNVVRVEEDDMVICDLGLERVTSPSLPAVNENGITQCTNISFGIAGFATDVFEPTEVVEFSGPGQLYLGPAMVLFIEDTASPLSDFIENSRTRFPPVIPDLDVEIIRRGDQLVLNLDDQNAGQDGPPASTTDALELLGAECREVQAGESVIYTGNTLRVRQGLSEISRDTVQQLDSVLNQNIAGRRCDVLTRDRESRNGFLPGPGFLCVGGSGIDMSERAGFFTNSSSVSSMIVDTLVDRQLRCSVNGPSIVGNFTPNVGMALIRLNEEVTTTFPELSELEKTADEVRISDRFGNVQESYRCGSGVTLTIWDTNTVRLLGTGDTTTAPIVAPPGGKTVIFNPIDCFVFAYPTGLTSITRLISMCRESGMATPAPAVMFSSSTNSFGSTTILANGDPILTASTSTSISVGRGQTVTYTGNTVRILESGSTIGSISGVRSFVANTAFNRLVSASGMTNQAFSGPGDLYADSDGRAFFTNSASVSRLIENSISNVPSQSVDVVPRRNGSVTVGISLQIGGTPFFDIPSPENNMDVGSNEGVSFTSGVVRVDNAANIQASSSLTYFPSDDVLQVGDVNLTMIGGFFVGNPIGGNPDTITMEVTFSGGGILYQGGGGAFYWPSNRVPTTMVNLDFIEALGVSAIDDGFPMPIDGIETCAVYDGTLVRTFNRSAFNLLPGPGFLSINGNQCFFTNDLDLIQRIPEAFARFLPSVTTYNSSTGIISVTTGTGESIANFSIGSRTLQAPDGRIMFSGGNINSTGSFIAGDIDRFIFFDGFQTIIVDTPDGDDFTGGGFLVIDEETRTAFYTISGRITNDIISTILNAMRTFRPPDIPDSEPDELRSKLNEINTGFGQFLTVYEGAEVNLRCDAGNANPPSTITFFMRSNFSGDDPFMLIMNSSDIMIIVNGVNDVTLSIPDIPLDPGELEFRCEARNPVSRVSRTTSIRVLPNEPPVIDNSFFAGRASPGEQVVTARTAGNMLTIRPIIAPSMLGSPEIDDPSQLTDRVSIGCKATGRPQPDITWSVSVGGDPFMEVDTSGPEANVTSRRQGQSVLTVALESGDTACFVYRCVAGNGAPTTAEAFAQVCPRRFDSEPGSPPNPSDCSATCGIGVQMIVETFRVSFNGTSTTTTMVPAGLVKPSVVFCVAPVRTCPVITLEFQVEEFSNCSSFCEEGNRTRVVQCVEVVDGMVNQTLNDSFCMEIEKPDEEIPCNSGPCPVYVDNGFGPCSSSCKGGVRMRSLLCLMPTIDEDTGKFTFIPGEFVDLDVCFNYSMRPQPRLVEECNFKVPCPVRYFPGPFGECDEFNCQVRSVFCSNYDPSDPLEAWPANETECVEQGLIRLSSVRSCGGGICEFGNWNAVADSEANEGGCSEECGEGTLQRVVTCVNSTDPESAVIEDGFCDFTLRPSEEVPCFIRNCPEQCISEPFVCPFLRKLRMCKAERLADLTEQCCISCPFQASPVPPLETETRNTTEAAPTIV